MNLLRILFVFFLILAASIGTVSAWDVSSSTYIQSKSVSTEETSLQGVFFKPDGTKMYVTGVDSDSVHEYDLSVAWNITTASYLQNISVSAKSSSPQGVFFKPDGTKMYIIGGWNEVVYEYDLSVAWNVTTALYLQEHSISVKSPSPKGIFFKPDGAKMYVIISTGRYVNEYNLGIQWDVTSASYSQNMTVVAQELAPNGVFFKPDGAKMYVVGNDGDDVNEYNLSVAWDVTAATYYQKYSVKTESLFPSGIFFEPNGKRMYISDFGVDGIFEYYLNNVPTTPTLVSPSNTSTQLSQNATLNTTSTDRDAEAITYYYYGGTSKDNMVFLGTNDSVGSFSFNWTISTYDVYYWTCFAGDGYENSSNMTTAQFTLIAPPNLTSPTNSSTTYTTYPPLTSDVTFTWQDLAAPQYRIITATDSNFNVIFSDIWLSTNTSTQSLLVNDQYWWRVYAYDGSTYSDSSDIFNFNLTGNSTLSGSAIEGVVYADIDGVYTALSSAEVIIWNATWSDSAITGSNGYYVFEGLTSGQVYSVQAKKDLYIDSSVSLVTAGADPITNNFYLLPDRTSEEWRHYVKFTVQTIWGTKYPNVDVTVYENDDVTATYTGTTGSDGAATFILNRQQEYRITFINSTLGISETRTLYPKDTHYYIIVSSVLDSWDTYDVPISDAIDFTISKSEINATHAYINVSYSDSLGETTSLVTFLNQTNESDYFNQTNLDTWNAGATSSGLHSFIVEDYAGESYIVHLLVTHTTYGTIDSTYSVSFKDDIATNFPGIPPSAFLYSSIFILLFTGGIFVHRDVERGMLIVCIMFFVFYGLGAFNTLPSNVTDSMLAGGILAFILSIIANLNKSNKDEGFS